MFKNITSRLDKQFSFNFSEVKEEDNNESNLPKFDRTAGSIKNESRKKLDVKDNPPIPNNIYLNMNLTTVILNIKRYWDRSQIFLF